MAQPTAREQQLQQEIQRLKETLEERDEEIFDLHVSVSTANTELEHGLSKMREHSQSTIRRLEEELRRLRHENHRMMQQKQRNATEKIITPQYAGKKRSQAVVAAAEASRTKTATAATTDSMVDTPVANKPVANTIPTIQSTHWILMHISPLLCSNPHIMKRLFLASNEIEVIKLLIASEEWDLVLAVLKISPISCRYLAGTTTAMLGNSSSLMIGATTVPLNDGGGLDLLNRLWTPNKQISSAKVTDSSDAQLLTETLWETAAQSPEQIPIWEILRYLLRHYDLPFSETHETSLLERVIQVGRQCTITPRRLGFDEYRDETSPDSTTVGMETPNWLSAAISCLGAYTCRTGKFQELQQSKPWSTWFAVILDLVQQTDDETIRLSIVRWLRHLASSHWDALDTYLRVEIVTSATTAELWHRAPSPIHVVCDILTKALSDEEAANKSDSDFDLFRREPTELMTESIRFIYAIVVAVQEARRQETPLTLWDVTPAETLAANVARLLDRTKDNEEVKRMLSTILDELEEDHNERYAKYKSTDS